MCLCEIHLTIKTIKAMNNISSPVVYLPSNLDIAKHLAQFPPVDIPSFNEDKLKYIIGLVNSIPLDNKRLYTPDGFVPIHAHTLQNSLRDYRLYLDYAIHSGILVSDNFYVPGSKSFSFRFTEQYNTAPIPHPVSKYTIQKLISQQYIYKSDPQATTKNSSHKYSNLQKWFNGALTIDEKRANAYLVKEYHKNLNKSSEFNARRKYHLQHCNLTRFATQDYFFKVDSTSGRLHTNLTNMKSGLRNFIKYDGLELVSVDIKNSQPFLSTALLNGDFYKNSNPKITGTLKSKGIFNNKYTSTSTLTIQEIMKYFEYSNINNKNNRISELLSSLMIVKNEQSLAAVEFQQYSNITAQGIIYEYIETEISAITGKFFNDRKELKSVIFQVLFTDNRFFGQKEAEAKRIFRDLFPNIYNIFALIKKGDASTLPRLLQAIEAIIILDRVCNRISIENPYLPIFTIHDSVACPVGHETYVASIIKDEMLNAIGLCPSLKYEYWSPNSLLCKN
jgi:hypothetical protein